MANVRTSIDIAVPPERVWELVTDLERLGEWVSIHRDFPEPPPAEVREGTRFHQTVALGGTPFAVEWIAIEVDGPQRLAWDGTGPAGGPPARRTRSRPRPAARALPTRMSSSFRPGASARQRAVWSRCTPSGRPTHRSRA